MSRVYKGLVNGSLTVEVSDRLRHVHAVPGVGPRTKELTLRLYDDLVADRDLIRESWYLDDPEKGYGHRRRTAAHARYDRFKDDLTGSLLLAVEKEPATEGYEGSSVYADLTRGFWSHDGPEDVPGELLGRLTRNRKVPGNRRPMTRRKWKLV